MTKKSNKVSIEALNKLAEEILVNDKERNNKLQQFVELFIDNFNTELTHNATPLSNLVKGLKKTDAVLIKEYFASVTNARLYLNAKGNYTVKYNIAADTDLTTNDKYKVTKWWELAKKAEVIVKDYYDSIDKAKKALDNTILKALNTAKNPEEREEIIKYIKEQF